MKQILFYLTLFCALSVSAQNRITNNAAYNLNGFRWYWTNVNGDTTAVLYPFGGGRFFAPFQYSANFSLTDLSLTHKKYVDSLVAANAGGTFSLDTTSAAGVVTKTELKDSLENQKQAFDGTEFQVGSDEVVRLKTLPFSKLDITGPRDANSVVYSDGVARAAPGAGTATTDASQLTTGTLADARLSTNVPLKNAANTYTATQTFAATTMTTLNVGATSWDNANFNAETGSGRSTTQLNFRNSTSTGVHFRSSSRGSSTTGMTANYDYFSHVMGRMNVTKAATGTHPYIGQLYLTNVNATGTAPLSIAALMVLEDGNVGSASNDTFSIFAFGKARFSRIKLNNLINTGVSKVFANERGEIERVTNPDGDPDNYYDMIRKGTTTTSSGSSSTVLTIGVPDNTFGVIQLDIEGIDANNAMASFRRLLRYKKVSGALTILSEQTIGTDYKDSGTGSTVLTISVVPVVGNVSVAVTGNSFAMNWRCNSGSVVHTLTSLP